MSQHRLPLVRFRAMQQASALFVAVCLVLPSPALALRQAGLEENASKEEFLGRLGVVTPSPIPTTAGMEEVEKLLADFPRLRAPDSFLSRHTELPVAEAIKVYYQGLISKVAPEGTSPQFIRKALFTLEQLESVATKLWPSFPQPVFQSITLVLDRSGFATAARGSNRRLTINLDPEEAFHPSRYSMWVYIFAHEIGELIHAEYPEIKRLEETSKGSGSGRKQHLLRVAEVIRQGYPGHPYIRVPVFGEDFFNTWGPKAFWGAPSHNVADIVADAIALKLLAKRSNLPILEGYKARYQTVVKMLQDALGKTDLDSETAFHFLRIIIAYRPFHEFLGEAMQPGTMDQIERQLMDFLNESLVKERQMQGFFPDDTSMWNEGTEPPLPLPDRIEQVRDKVLASYQQIVRQLAGMEESKRLWIDGPLSKEKVPGRLAFWGRENFLKKGFSKVEYHVSVTSAERRATFTLRAKDGEWERKIREVLDEQLGDWDEGKGWFLLANGPEFTALERAGSPEQETQIDVLDETIQKGDRSQFPKLSAKLPPIEVILEPFHPDELRGDIPPPMKAEETSDYLWHLFVKYLALAADEGANGIVLSMDGTEIREIRFPIAEAANLKERAEFRQDLLLVLRRLGPSGLAKDWVLSAGTRLDEENWRELTVLFKRDSFGAASEKPTIFSDLIEENARKILSAASEVFDVTSHMSEDGLIQGYGLGLIDREGKILYFGSSGG